MRQGELGAPAPDTASQELAQGLRLLEETQGLLRGILLGVVMQYKSLDMEREKLLTGEGASGGCGPREVQIAASIITLYALFGFQNQAQALANQAAQAGRPDWMDVNLGVSSILITLIRLFRLCGPEEAGGGEAALEEAELLDEPVI